MRASFSFALFALAAGCKTIGWDGAVQQWGSVREVLREGKTDARVYVFDAASGPDTVGLGALAGLEGEITIADGTTWISRATSTGKIVTTQGGAGDSAATLLVTASVPAWVELPIDQDVPLSEIASWTGFGTRAWPVAPFIVRGRLLDLEAHVAHGACPRAGEVPPGREPARRRAASAFGTLVGFWARDGAGTITHQGEDVHAHVIVRGAESWTAHVDRVRIGAGSTLYVPRDQERVSVTYPTR